jgi:hypothetical protein
MPVVHHASSRTPKAKKEIHKQAKHLKKKRPGMSWEDAHGVATGMVTKRKKAKRNKK